MPKQPTRSPYVSPEMKALAGDAQRARLYEKAMADLLALHTRFLKGIEDHTVTVKEFKDHVASIAEHAERIQNLPPGEKGDSVKGDDGDSPDPEIIIAEVLKRMPPVKHGVSPDADLIATRVITRLKSAEKKEDVVVDMPAIIEAVIEHLTEKKVLKKEHINGLDEEISSYRNQLAGKIYGKNTWARGGGGSGTSGGGAPLTPTGAVNAVNAVFGVLSQPSSVVSDGITYFEGAGYSYAALSITLDVPPSQYIRYYA